MTNLKNGSRSNDARDVNVARVDMKLDVIVILVSDAAKLPPNNRVSSTLPQLPRHSASS